MVSMTFLDIKGLKGILLTIDNWLWTGYVLTRKSLKGSNDPDSINDINGLDIKGSKGILLTIDNWLWTGYVLTPKTLKGSNDLDGINDIHGHQGFLGYTIDYWLLTLDRLCLDPQNPKR